MFLNATESAAKADFEIHPKGVANGVCVEVVTHNKKTGEPFTKQADDGQIKQRIILVFQTNKTTENADGEKVNCVFWDWHNVPQSIANENSTLHKRLKEWEVPIQDFNTKEDFESAVVGRPATLMFSHNTSETNKKTYSNLTGIAPIEEGTEAFVAKDYKAYNQEVPY
jgi:hypothetical protein